MQDSQTIQAYRQHAAEAISGWAKRRGLATNRKIPPFLKRVLKDIRNSRLCRSASIHVLDLGCGPGFDSLEFVRAGFHVTGIDLTPDFLNHARTLLRRAGGLRVLERQRARGLPGSSRFIRMDLRNPRLPQRTFGLVWANASLIHVRKRELVRVLRRLNRLLQPGGILAATFFHGRGEGVYRGSYIPGRFFARYEKGEIRERLIEGGFRPIEIKTVVNEDRKGRWVNVIAQIYG